MSKPFPDVPIPEAHKAGAERARRMFVSVPMTEGEKLPDPDPEEAMTPDWIAPKRAPNRSEATTGATVPNDWTALEQAAQQANIVEWMKIARAHVESSALYKRFIEHTPLENDIGVWMVEFAEQRLADLLTALQTAHAERDAAVSNAHRVGNLLRASIRDVWEARDEAQEMRRSWRLAEGGLDEADKENDRHIAWIVELEAALAQAQAALREAWWKGRNSIYEPGLSIQEATLEGLNKQRERDCAALAPAEPTA